MDELYTFYNLSECLDIDEVISKLDDFLNDGKIEYYLLPSSDVIKIIDTDLSDEDIYFLIDFLDSQSVLIEYDFDDSDFDDLDDYFNQDYE